MFLNLMFLIISINKIISMILGDNNIMNNSSYFIRQAPDLPSNMIVLNLQRKICNLLETF